MTRPIGIGNQDFEKIRINNNFYIDKTKFIHPYLERAVMTGITRIISLIKRKWGITGQIPAAIGG